MKRITVPEEGIETLFGSYDENLKHFESPLQRPHPHPGARSARRRRTGQPRQGGPRRRPAVFADARRPEAVERRREDRFRPRRAGSRSSTCAIISSRAASPAAGKRRIAPKTVNQRRYLDAIDQNDIVFGIGPAGTGKTYLAMAQAVAFLGAKKVSRITWRGRRSEAARNSASCRATLQEKVIRTCGRSTMRCTTCSTSERVARYIERGTIEIAPIAFMRGDAQRLVRDPRRGAEHHDRADEDVPDAARVRAKAVITGDITQIDCPGRTSGLGRGDEVVSAIEGIEFIHFDDRDVVRHKLVQQIVKAYDAYSNRGSSRPPPLKLRRASRVVRLLERPGRAAFVAI
jgi:phosphate starvation-inducible PhoH-like protein